MPYNCPRCKALNPLMWGKGKCVHCGYYENPTAYGKTYEQVKAFNESKFVETENETQRT
jgi:ribosomal protein L37AE/L43A